VGLKMAVLYIGHSYSQWTGSHHLENFKTINMKKLIPIIIIALFASSCSKYINTGGGGCGVWMPKKYTGTYKAPNTNFRRLTGVH
jgi:tellurite resistance protein TehA-like permease